MDMSDDNVSFPIYILGIVIVLILGVFAFKNFVVGGDVFGYEHRVEGVVSDVSSRMVMEQGERFTVALDVIVADDEVLRTLETTAGGSALVECASTRCSALKPGDEVALDCQIDGRVFEPNVVICKLKRHQTPRNLASLEKP